MYKFVNTRTKIIVFFIDLAGFFLWVLFHIFTPWKIVGRKPVPDNPQKILLIRADYIGDVLLTTHTLKGIRERFPKSQISYLVSSKSREVLEGNPYIDRIITYDPPWFFNKDFKTAFSEYMNVLSLIRKERFTLAADFRGDARNIFLLTVLGRIPFRVSFASSGGWFLLTTIADYPPLTHESAYHTIIAETLGAKVEKTALPEMFIGEKEREFAKLFFSRYNINNNDVTAVIHQGARLPLKQWPLERYGEVGRYLVSKHGAKIILTGAYGEVPVVERLRELIGSDSSVISAAGTTGSLKELKAIFDMCGLFIGTSSGPSHIAACAGVPVVLISGPESVAQWRPIGNKCIILKKEYPCCPCNEKECPYIDKGENCILAVKTEDVKNAIDEILRL